MIRPRGPRAAALHFLHGLLMGGADIIPGVSGGTMALIVGIYERLISSVRALASAATSFVRARAGEARLRLREVEWWLVVPLGVGALTAIKLGAYFIPALLARHPEEMRAFFFGLILASLVIPWKRMERVRSIHYGVAVAAAVAAFVLVGLPPREIPNPSLLIVFLAASVAICAMILPGVSGSFLLFVMGLYAPTLQALNALDLPYIAVFAGGAVLGLGAFSRLLDHLLRHHHDTTMAALVGLMGGSLRALWPWQDVDRTLLAPPEGSSTLAAAGLVVLGVVLITLLVRFGNVAAAPRSAPPG